MKANLALVESAKEQVSQAKAALETQSALIKQMESRTSITKIIP